jgi:hypothetical protein
MGVIYNLMFGRGQNQWWKLRQNDCFVEVSKAFWCICGDIYSVLTCHSSLFWRTGKRIPGLVDRKSFCVINTKKLELA